MKKRMMMGAALLMVAGARADTFGTGANQFTMDFVNIGNAGNAAQSVANRAHGEASGDGYGAVGYDYRIGMREVSIDQFATARAADSRIGDGNEDAWNDGTRTVGTSGPADRLTWSDAAKFANWLTTGDAHTGAYQFHDIVGIVGYTEHGSTAMDSLILTYGKVYVLPTEDEWFKAAYFNSSSDTYSLYASGSDSASSLIHGTSEGWNYSKNNQWATDYPNLAWETGFGAAEQNGTYDMMGNLKEWTESAGDGTLDDMAEDRVKRGGFYSDSEFALASSFRDDDNDPTRESYGVGFRVVAIPEPSSILLMTLMGGGALFVRRCFPRV